MGNTKTNDMLRIVHVSDQHGMIPSRNAFRNLLEIADLVVLSGDIFPYSTRGIRSIEETFQTEWMFGRVIHPVNTKHHARTTPLELWLEFLGELPVLVVGGNHDYVDFAKLIKDFRGENLLTHNLTTEGPIELFGLKFAGIAEIPWIDGEWNNETVPTDLRHATYDLFDQNPDVIVSHSPPAGILAGPYGSEPLTNCLSYRDHNVKAVLFGHVHEDGGKIIEESFGEDDSQTIIFSNAACHVNSVKIKNS
jgi:Icc-related predicted phosphoesterase